MSGVKPWRRCLPTDSHSRLFGGLLAAQQEPAQDMERVVLIPCVEPLRHTCLPASEAHSVQTGLWLSLFINYLCNFHQLKIVNFAEVLFRSFQILLRSDLAQSFEVVTFWI